MKQLSLVGLLLSVVPFFFATFEDRPQSAAVTWVDVAPILQKKCVTCHYSGGPAPFELSTYETAKRRALLMSVVTGEGAMPPCNASSEFGSFCDIPHLSDSERLILKQWASTGAKLGTDAPVEVDASSHPEWHTSPEYIAEISESIPAANIPYWKDFEVKIPEGKGAISSVQIRHSDALLFRSVALVTSGDGWQNSSRMFKGEESLRHTLGYRPIVLSDSYGIPSANGKIKIRARIHPLGKPIDAKAMIGFTFNSTATTKPNWISIGKDEIRIPANERTYKLRHDYRVKRDFSLLSIRPQVRLFATEIELLLIRPDKPTKKIFFTQRWNRFAMGSYCFESPIFIESDSVIRLTVNYDNSSSNPFNPNSPPTDQGSGKSLDSPSFWAHLLVNDSNGGEQLLELVKSYRP